MLFSNYERDTQVQLEVEGVDIERLHENKFLGVIIDDKINWKPHAKRVKNKLSRSRTNHSTFSTVHWLNHI